MGFSLGNLLRQAGAQINPFDHGQTAATVRQQQQRPVMAQLPSHLNFSPKAQAVIQARNPAQAQSIIARGVNTGSNNPVPHFNPITAAPGAFKDAVVNTSKSIGNSVVNTAQVPYSAGRVMAANITNNQPALQNAHKALASDTGNNLVWNDAYRQTSNELAGALRNNPTIRHAMGQQTDLERNHDANVQLGNTLAQAYGNSKRAKLYGELVASANDQNDINQTLGEFGLTPTTSRAAMGVRLSAPIVSAGAQTALQMTGAGQGAKLAESAVVKQAAKLTAEQAAKKAGIDLTKTSLKYGAANAGIGILNPIAQGSTNPMDYVKAGVGGFAGGAAFPIAGAALSKGGTPLLKAGDKTIKAAQTKATTNARIDAGINEITKQQQALQQKINSAPLNATRGTESLNQHINILEGQKAQLHANRPQMNPAERLLGMQVGGSTRPIKPATVPKATPAPKLNPDEEIRSIYNRANKSRGGKLTITEEKRIAELQATPVNQEKLSISNSDITRTKSPGMGQDGFTVEEWGGKKRFVSLDGARPETKAKIHKAEAEYEAAKRSSTGHVVPGTRGRVQIAREQVENAYSDAINDLKLHDYATSSTGKRTFNSRYNDWLETKYRDRNIDSTTIKDMAADPQKYRQQFEAETATASAEKPAPVQPEPSVPGQSLASKGTGEGSLPINVTQRGTDKAVPVSKVIQDGRQVTKTNLTTGKEKSFTIDANGEMQPDTNGAYKIFTDDDGKVTSFRVGDEVFDAKDLGGLDDVNGYGSTVATMRRNIERAFPQSNDKVNRFLVDHQQAQATKLIDRRVQLNKGMQAVADDLGISFGVGRHNAKKVSAAIQDYGEGKVTKAQLNEKFGQQQANKIVQADKWFRKQYDSLLDEMNGTLTKYGYDPVPKRKDYYTHFSEPGLWQRFGLKMQELRDLTSPTMQDADPAAGRGGISNKMAGQSEYLQPNKQFNRFALRRQGNVHTSDAFQAFEKYLNPTLSNIYMTPSITRARVLSKAIAENADLAGKDINKTVVQLREWANGLAGKSNRFGDRQLADTMNGQRVLKVLQFAQKRAGANTIVGNLATAALQPIVGAQAVGRFGAKNFLLAAAQEMGTAHGASAAIRQSQFMRRRYSNLTPVTAGKIDRAAEVANTPLKVVEETTARITWNAAHNKALSSGLKGKEAIRFADVEAEKTLGGRSIGERPELFNSKTLGPASMYQLEVNNFWQQFGKEMSTTQKASTLVAVYAFNLALQQATGKNVGFNPIDALIDNYKEVTSDDSVPTKIKKVAQRDVGEVVDNTPFVAPLANATIGGKSVQKLLGNESNTGRFGVSSPVSTLISHPEYLAIPFGGSQVEKTFQGIKAYAAGKITDKNGKELAQIPKTGANLARSVAFGKNAVPEVSKYYNSIGSGGSKPKDKNETGNANLDTALNQFDKNNKDYQTAYDKLSDHDRELAGLTKDQRQQLIDRKLVTANELKSVDDRINALKKQFGKDVSTPKTNELPDQQIAKSEQDYSKDPTVKAARDTMMKKLPPNMNGNDVATLQRFTGIPAAKKNDILAKEPQAEYKLKLAEFERDKHLNAIKPTDQASREAEVFKAKVGSDFNPEVRKVYAMTPAKMTAYLANHPDGNNLANAVVTYGDRLAQAGIENNKLANNKGEVSIVPKGTVIEAKSSRISQTAQKNGIPDNIFAALVKQESGGNQGAVSPVGAIGLTQLMPETAKGLGVDPRNPDQNLDGGARYLKQMYDKFGRWDYALAAYNAGPGAVEKYHGIPPFEETQNYVKSILGMVNGGIKGNDLNLVLSDPNKATGGAFNQSGVNTAASNSGPNSAGSIASAFGSTYSNPYKFSRSLRGIAQKASLGRSSTGTGKKLSSSVRLKAYKSPAASTGLHHKKLA